MPSSEPATLLMWALERLGIEGVRLYHRLDLTVSREALTEPGAVMYVANHGFGGIVDLNVLAALAALDDMGRLPWTTVLTHRIAWTLGVGRLLEVIGARPATRESADEARDAGRDVLVMPGGDAEYFRPWSERNRVVFDDRSGFADWAIERDVPVVPIVSSGAGESLLVLPGGRRLARITGAARFLRVSTLPVTVSIPWGLNVGLVGFLPYLPLPTKMRTTVLDPMRPREGEDAVAFAWRIRTAMQEALDRDTRHRLPVLGWRLPAIRSRPAPSALDA